MTSPLHRMRATDCPTVPKPSSATRVPSVDPMSFDVTRTLPREPLVRPATGYHVSYAVSVTGFLRHIAVVIIRRVRSIVVAVWVGPNRRALEWHLIRRLGVYVLDTLLHGLPPETQKGPTPVQVMALVESLSFVSVTSPAARSLQ